jgi:DNA polymerase III alpha subunit
VDPIELDLYFERFMNLYRKNPPDFDIDFSWRDREDVTQYIFDTFGKNGQASLLATYSTFQHSAAVRELGKVFGLPAYEIDALSDGKYDPNKLDQFATLVIKYAKYLQDNNQPNHLSIHAGGILISEKPIHHFTATDLPPKGFPTTQFDMVIAEDVGLNKYDILGQRGLAKIKETLEVIRYNRPDAPAFDIDNVKKFKTDPKINNLIKQASALAVFT